MKKIPKKTKAKLPEKKLSKASGGVLTPAEAKIISQTYSSRPVEDSPANSYKGYHEPRATGPRSKI